MSKRKKITKKSTSVQTNTLLEQVNTLINQKKFAEAEILCNQMLANKTHSFDVYFLCGSVAYSRKRYGDSIKYLGKALKLQPNNYNLILDKALAHLYKGEFQTVLDIVEKQIENRSVENKILARAYQIKAHTKYKLGQIEESDVLYKKSLDYDDSLLETYQFYIQDHINYKENYPSFLEYTKKIEELTTEDSDNLNYLMTRNHINAHVCCWDKRTEDIEALQQAILQHKIYDRVFIFLGLSDDPEIILTLNQDYCHHEYKPIDAFPLALRTHNKRIKVAYLSADLQKHATAFLIAEVLELHDDFVFEIYAYSYGPNIQDEMRERLTNAVEHFYEVSGWTDYQIAEHMYQQNIDIAVDLKGYTTYERLGIFALRPAPIQVSYLGYPSTTGTPFLDYVIGDKWVTPPHLQPYFTEKIVRMPHSYQPNDRHRVINPNIPTKTELGLPENSFVFCCFNNNYKITPAIFDIWCRILKQIPNGILWLLEDNPYSKENLIKEAEQRGIPAHRLVFAQRLELDLHLARHRQADLFLDTLPYNAHTTASDALWAELPVLTCPGNSFASRVGASLVDAVGLPEMIMPDLKTYEQTAIKLAQNPQMLLKIKQKLANNLKQCPLFDTTTYCADLETAYQKMYQLHRTNQIPKEFDVNEL